MPPEPGDRGPMYAERPELALAALVTLLGRYPFTRCDAMADAIQSHLCYVAFDARYPPELRQAAERVLRDWGLLDGGNAPGPEEAIH